jgi:hypothetical protein
MEENVAIPFANSYRNRRTILWVPSIRLNRQPLGAILLCTLRVRVIGFKGSSDRVHSNPKGLLNFLLGLCMERSSVLCSRLFPYNIRTS